MKIKYKKKYFKQYLIFAIVFTVLGFLNLKYSEGNNWLHYGSLFVASLYWSFYFYAKKYHYLVVDGNWIKNNFSFGKKINLLEVNWIKKYAGKYILMTDKDQMTINTELIDENSLTELNRIFEKLDLPSDKTPFSSIA